MSENILIEKCILSFLVTLNYFKNEPQNFQILRKRGHVLSDYSACIPKFIGIRFAFSGPKNPILKFVFILFILCNLHLCNTYRIAAINFMFFKLQTSNYASFLVVSFVVGGGAFSYWLSIYLICPEIYTIMA